MYNNRFGIEIEIPESINNSIVYRDDVHGIIEEALGASNSNHHLIDSNRENHKAWNVKEDSSCGWEITSPALLLTQKNFYDCLTILNNLNKIIKNDYNLDNPDQYLGEECGLHIHLSKQMIPSPLFNRLIKFYYAFENTLFEDYFPSRKNNFYLTPIRKIIHSKEEIESQRDFNQFNFAKDLDFKNHYTVVNYNNPHTIEFRYHHGTVDDKRIMNWLSFIIMSVYCSGIQSFPYAYGWNLGSKQDLINVIQKTRVTDWKSVIKDHAINFLTLEK